mgnify:CR=1 FL=1
MLPWVGWWRVFVKSGHAGWKCLIPIYNLIVFLKIIKRPKWWISLYFLVCLIVFLYPVATIFCSIILITDGWKLSCLFGQDAWFISHFKSVNLNHFGTTRKLNFNDWPFTVIFTSCFLQDRRQLFFLVLLSGQKLVYMLFGFPFIAFNKNAKYMLVNVSN